MAYVNTCVIAVPKANRERYAQHSKVMSALFKEYGALEAVDLVGVEITDGQQTSFIKAVQCKDSEEIVLSWIVWPSRKMSEEQMPKVMQDARSREQQTQTEEPLFDGRRAIFGNFEPVS